MQNPPFTLTKQERARLAAYLRALPIDGEPNRIRQALEYVRLNQKDYAALVGISREHLGNVVRGQASPTVDVARQIADGLGLGIDDLWPRVAA
jgi:DNA-binding XRE family transcriptional regulator